MSTLTQKVRKVVCEKTHIHIWKLVETRHPRLGVAVHYWQCRLCPATDTTSGTTIPYQWIGAPTSGGKYHATGY